MVLSMRISLPDCVACCAGVCEYIQPKTQNTRLPGYIVEEAKGIHKLNTYNEETAHPQDYLRRGEGLVELLVDVGVATPTTAASITGHGMYFSLRRSSASSCTPTS